MYDFDTVYDRHKTNSVKWDSIEASYHETDLLPLWVADMDFPAPPAVQQAFKDYAAHGIYGYTIEPPALRKAVIEWQKRRHQYELAENEIMFFSGVLAGVATAVQALTEPGDAVLIHDPVYPPFADMVKRTHRKLIRSSLIEKNNRFEMDFADLEEKFNTYPVKALILCNPHNPGGRVWSRDELRTLGELCRRYQVLVLCDEIHQDLVFSGTKLTSFQTVDPSFAEFSLVFASATKTFNLAGIKNSLLFVKNPELKKKITAKQLENFQQEINTFGLIGTEAAFSAGEQWLDSLLPYLQENIDFVIQTLHDQLPQVTVMKPEGTYLMWLDFSAFGLSDSELFNTLIHEAKVVLNPGITYGASGKQRMRLNVACPRKTLAEGLTRLITCLSQKK